MTVVVVLLAIAVGVLALLVFGLLRTHAEILRALDRAGISLDDGEAAGSSTGAVPQRTAAGASADPAGARDLVGTVPAGGPTKVAVTGVARLTLLAFLSPGCRTCRRFWEAFSAPDLELPGGDTRLVIVGQDPVHDSESAMAELVPAGVKAVLSSAAWEDYDVPGSPYFVLVDGAEGRVVGAGSALRWEQLQNLLQQALADAGLSERVPAERVPAERVPAERVPAERVPAERVPAERVPAERVPAERVPAERVPAERVPAERVPAEPSGLQLPGVPAGRSGRRRAQRADEALRSAGIGPGHPSLYGGQPDSNGRDGADSSGSRAER